MIDCIKLFFGPDVDINTVDIEKLDEHFKYLLELHSKNKDLSKVITLCYRIISDTYMFSQYKKLYENGGEVLYIECPYCKIKNDIYTEFCVKCGWDFRGGSVFTDADKYINELEKFIKSCNENRSSSQDTPVGKQVAEESRPLENNNEEEVEEDTDTSADEKLSDPNMGDNNVDYKENTANKTIVGEQIGLTDDNAFEKKTSFIPYIKNLNSRKEVQVTFTKNDSGAYVFRIGRNPDNDLAITSEDAGNYYRQFSRYHAEIYETEGRYYLKDISTNGTYVDGRKINKRVVSLFGGEIIGYKNYKLIFFFKLNEKEAK